MPTALALLAIIAVVSIARLALGLIEHRAPAIDRHVGRRLVVHLRDGASLSAVLADTAPDALALRMVEHLGETGTRTPLDGSVIVPRDRLDFFQVLDDPAGDQ